MEIKKIQLIKIKTLMSKKGLLAFSKDLAFSFSDERTEHVSELTTTEAYLLTEHLEKGEAKSPKEKMQRKLLSMAHEQNWKHFDGKIDIERVNRWCIKYGYLHKPFNDYTVDELPALVTAFEQMYSKHLNSI